MPNLTQAKKNNTTYNIKDVTAREEATNLKSALNRSDFFMNLNGVSYTINAGTSSFERNLFEVVLTPGTYTISCVQSNSISSVDRNRFKYTYNSRNTYEDADNLLAGNHEWTFTITSEGTYLFAIWVANPSQTVTIGSFVLTKAIVDDIHNFFAKTNEYTVQYNGDEPIQYTGSYIPDVLTARDVIIVQPGTIYIKDQRNNNYYIAADGTANVTLDSHFNSVNGRMFVTIEHGKKIVLNTATRAVEYLPVMGTTDPNNIVLASSHRGAIFDGAYKRVMDTYDHIYEYNKRNEAGFGTPDFVLNDASEELTFVGDELWIFASNPNDHTEYGRIQRYSVDFETNQITSVGTLKQNWGHCNTVDYNEKNDCLILGNGSGNETMEYNEFYIIPNVSALKVLPNNTELPLDNYAIKYRLSEWGDHKYGKQINTVWGHSNGERNDIAFILSNADGLQFIRMIQLGKGSNIFNYGVPVSGVSENEFNGTFREIEYWYLPYSDTTALQGGCYYNGNLYFGIGHDGLFMQKIVLGEGHHAEASRQHERHFSSDGTVEANWTEGVTIRNGYIFIGYVSGSFVKTFGYKLPS